MAIRQVAPGVNVYSIDVDVPKPTDSRGKGYGSLVSDLRWKLWEEVQASQLQQMKFDQMTREAQLNVLQQKQQDISRAIRDARELQAKVKADFDSDGATSTWMKARRASQGTRTVTEKPEVNPYTGKQTGGTLRTTQTRTPIGGYTKEELDFLRQQAEGGDAEAQAKYNEAAAADAQERRNMLEQYIADLEAQQSATGEEFQKFVSAGAGPDLLQRTRGAFQSQVGVGGFGIAPRRLRELPSFDEREAAGRISNALGNEEAALYNNKLQEINKKYDARLQEIRFMLGPNSEAESLLQNLKNGELEALQSPAGLKAIKDVAAANVVGGLREAGAEPVSSRAFLRKELPEMPTYIPSSPERPPAPRAAATVGIEGEVPLTREQEIAADIMRGGELGRDAALRGAETAPRPQAPSPLSQALGREVELEALGASAEEIAAAQAATAQVAKSMEEERLNAGAVPKARGFSTPVEDFGPVTTTTFGKPGGLMDRLALRRLQSAPPAPVEDIVIRRANAGAPIPTEARGGQVEMTDEFGNPIPVATPKEQLESLQEDLRKRQQNVESIKALQEAAPQAKVSTEARRDLYAMRVTKRGVELAEKPKQFARIAKTDNPSAAPEYVKIVNDVYDVNRSRPDRFKLTYDEVARVYKNDPKTREKAHEFLIAKDSIESNVTTPMA